MGAAIGGIVGAFFGRDTVFVLNALSFLASAFLISGMRFAEPTLTLPRRFVGAISWTSLRYWRGFGTSAITRLCYQQCLPRLEKLWWGRVG